MPNAELGRTDTIKQMDRAKIFTITVTDTTTRNNLIMDLRNLSEILFVEANGSDTASLAPNDLAYQQNQQWDLNNLEYPGDDIHALTAWDIFTGSTSSIIGIIDEGVDVSQTDLSNKIIGGDNTFYVETLANQKISHGTVVAGIAAASTNNGIGIAGVDWNAKILPEDKHDYYNCFCLSYINHTHGWNLIAKKTLAAVNFSPNVWTLNHSYKLDKGFLGANYSIVLAEAFAYAAKNNRVSCVASGNDNSSSTSIYPANYSSQIIDVGGSDEQDNRVSNSNYGANLDVVAPGLNIAALNYTQFGSLVSESGTSVASPIVAGIASLLKGYNNNLYNDDIEQLIKISADDKGAPGRNDLYGYGRVNAATALNYLKPPSSLQHFTAAGGTAYSTSNMSLEVLGGRSIQDNLYHVVRTEVRKTINLPNNYCLITGVWGTGLKTTGWHDNNGFCYGDGFCEVVPGSLTSTQATLRTYVYQIYDASGFLEGYYPRAPQNVIFAYSVLGITGPNAISGDNSFCTTSNQYTIPNLPAGATVTWSASPYGVVQINSLNANSTTLTKVIDGVITLTAIINNGCGTNQITVSKEQITVGNVLTGTINQSGVLTPMNTVNSVAAGATSVSFQWPGVSGISCTQSSTNPPVSQTGFIYYAYNNSFWFTLSSGQSITVSFSGTGCGGTTIATRSFTVGGHYYVVSPNPASGTINITPTSPGSNLKTESSQTTTTVVQVSIMDVNGILKKQQQFSSSTANLQLNVADLIPGTYFVRIINGNINETQKLIINR